MSLEALPKSLEVDLCRALGRALIKNDLRCIRHDAMDGFIIVPPLADTAMDAVVGGLLSRGWKISDDRMHWCGRETEG